MQPSGNTGWKGQHDEHKDQILPAPTFEGAEKARATAQTYGIYKNGKP